MTHVEIPLAVLHKLNAVAELATRAVIHDPVVVVPFLRSAVADPTIVAWLEEQRALGLIQQAFDLDEWGTG